MAHAKKKIMNAANYTVILAVSTVVVTSPDAKEAQLRFQVWPKGVDASDLQKHRGLAEKPWCCVAPWAEPLGVLTSNENPHCWPQNSPKFIFQEISGRSSHKGKLRWIQSTIWFMDIQEIFGKIP